MYLRVGSVGWSSEIAGVRDQAPPYVFWDGLEHPVERSRHFRYYRIPLGVGPAPWANARLGKPLLDRS